MLPFTKDKRTFFPVHSKGKLLTFGLRGNRILINNYAIVAHKLFYELITPVVPSGQSQRIEYALSELNE